MAEFEVPSGVSGQDSLLVYDTSPLILLDGLGYLPALREMGESLAIPDAVARELSRQPGKPGPHVPELDWVVTKRPSEATLRRVLEGPPAVDAGEAEAIALALGEQTNLIIDESKGRARARRLGVGLSGTIGELLLLRNLGCTAAYSRRRPEEDGEVLIGAGMRISDSLRVRVLNTLRTRD